MVQSFTEETFKGKTQNSMIPVQISPYYFNMTRYLLHFTIILEENMVLLPFLEKTTTTTKICLDLKELKNFC